MTQEKKPTLGGSLLSQAMSTMGIADPNAKSLGGALLGLASQQDPTLAKGDEGTEGSEATNSTKQLTGDGELAAECSVLKRLLAKLEPDSPAHATATRELELAEAKLKSFRDGAKAGHGRGVAEGMRSATK